MPKKHAASKKKTSARRTIRTAKPVMSSSSAMKASLLSQPYLAKEQDEFHQAHPNARALIALFIVLVIVLAGLYFARFGFARMPY